MATMRELSGLSSNRASTPTVKLPTGTYSPEQIQQQQIVDSRLDTAATMAQGADKIAGAYLQGNEDAAKLRASDKYMQFVKGNQYIDSVYDEKKQNGQALTSDDYKQRIEWKQKFYEQLRDSGVDVSQDKDTTIYRDMFIKPAVTNLEQDIKRDSQLYLNAFRQETVEKFKNEMDSVRGEVTSDVVNTWRRTLEEVGVDNSKDFVYNKVAEVKNSQWTNKFMNGANSIDFQPYLQQIKLGKMSVNEAMMDIYNRNYGEFMVIDENGEFHRTDENITVTAYDKMKKAYFSLRGMLDGSGSEKYDITADKAVDALSVESQSEALDKAEGEVEKQFNVVFTRCQAGAKGNACSQADKLRDSKLKLDILRKKQETLDGIYDAYKKTGELLSNDTTYSAVVKSLSGFDDLSVNYTVTKDDVNNYINHKLKAEIENSFKDNQSTVNSVSDLASYTKKLSYDGNGGKATSYGNTAVQSTQNGSFIDSSDTVDELMKRVTFVADYNDGGKTTGSFSHINNSYKKRMYDYYTKLKDRQATAKENGIKPITDAEALDKMKIYSKVILKNQNKLSYQTTQTKLRDIGLHKGDDVDALASSSLWTGGKTTLANGTIGILTTRAINSGLSFQDVDSFAKFGKSYTLTLDDSWMPFIGSSLTVVNPTGIDKNKKKAIGVFNTAITNTLFKNVEVLGKADLSDYGDEFDNIQVSQLEDSKYGLVTVVNLIKNGSIIDTAILRKEDFDKAAADTIRTNKTLEKYKDKVPQKRKRAYRNNR